MTVDRLELTATRARCKTCGERIYRPAGMVALARVRARAAERWLHVDSTNWTDNPHDAEPNDMANLTTRISNAHAKVQADQLQLSASAAELRAVCTEAREQGWSWGDLASHLGVTRGRVQAIVKPRGDRR